MVGGCLRANLKLIEFPLNCQGVRVNSYGYSLAKTFSCEYLLMKLFFSLSCTLELWIMLSHLFKWDICFVQAVSGTLVTWCCALMIGLLLPFGNKSCFLMFCINVVSCYTELTRKGMLLTVVNGKKAGGGEFQFPNRNSTCNLLGFWLSGLRTRNKEGHYFDFRSWLGISFFSFTILTLAALFLIYWG